MKRKPLSPDELKEVLLYSDNDVWRDDAAELLADHWQNDSAEVILIEAIESGLLDESLKLTCVESLAAIWNRRGKVNESIYGRLKDPIKDKLNEWLNVYGLSAK